MKILGKVVKGRGAGRALGFPTANLELPNLPGLEKGIFLAETLYRGKIYKSLAVIGVAKEFEVWLLDFNGDLYSEILEVQLGQKISEVEIFENNEKLINKIQEDIKKAKKIWGRP